VLTKLFEINIYYFPCFSMILGDLVMKEHVGEKGNFILCCFKTLRNSFKAR